MKFYGVWAALAACGFGTAASADQLDLSGFYAGGTVIFGSGSTIEKSNTFDYVSPSDIFEDFNQNSPAVGIIGGYNAFSGDTFFGVEVDIRGDLQRKEQEDARKPYSISYTRPYGRGTCYGCPPGILYFENGNQPETLARRYSYSFEEKIAPTLSARFGHQFDRWLIFGRVGAGLARIKETFTTDDRGSKYCGRLRSRTEYAADGSFETFNDSCLDPYNGTVTTASETITRPTATFAIGAEYHFNRFFTRVEGEVRHLFLNEKLDFGPTNGTTRYQVGTTIGIRF